MRDSLLVVGAGGFIGKRLTEALLDAGHRVIASSRTPAGLQHLHLEWADALASREDFLRALPRAHTVVHLATSSTPGSSFGKPLEELDNLVPTLSLLQALQDHPNVKLVYVSSGGTLYTRPSDFSATEDTQTQSRSYHGAGKAAAEHFIEAWCLQHGGSATILRPSNVYGPGQLPKAGFGVIANGFEKIRRQDPIQIWGDGTATRDYLYIDDFIDLCMRVVSEHAELGFDVLNAASGVGVSLNQLMEAMEEVTGKALIREFRERRPLDASHVVIDASKARLRYGWSATTPLKTGLGRTWNWLSTLHP